VGKKQRKRGMESIFQHGTSSWIAFYDHGKQVKERVGPIGLITKGQAEEELKARLGKWSKVDSIWKRQRKEFSLINWWNDIWNIQKLTKIGLCSRKAFVGGSIPPAATIYHVVPLYLVCLIIYFCLINSMLVFF